MINANKGDEKAEKLNEQNGDVQSGDLTFDQYKKRGESLRNITLLAIKIRRLNEMTAKLCLIDIQPSDKCAQRSLRSAGASAQSDQNLRSPHEGSLATH